MRIAVIAGMIAIIVTQIASTLILVKHVDSLQTTNVTMDIYRIENRLESIDHYICAANRSLESIDSSAQSAAERMRHHIDIESCPGDPGQLR